MRIVAGAFRGRRLATLGDGDAPAHLRPTTDRVRESLFNILSHMDVVENARVLDLFAGSGALGLEALSRGAAHVTFVENGRVGAGVIRDNIRLTNSMGTTRLLRNDARRMGACPEDNTGGWATLVFLDPPYGQGLGAEALISARAGGWIAPGACIVWEEGSVQSPPPGFIARDDRRFGSTFVTFMEAQT